MEAKRLSRARGAVALGTASLAVLGAVAVLALGLVAGAAFAGDGGLGPDLPPGPLPKVSPSPSPPAPTESPTTHATPSPNQSPQTVTRVPGASPSPTPPPTSLTSTVKDALRPRRLPVWLALEEEDAPEPPIVKADVGLVGWPFLRTSFQFGRRSGSAGSDIDDVEATVHLPRQGLSPWGEFSLGNELRVGGNVLDLDRVTNYHQVTVPIDVRGILLANPGDYVRTRFHLTQAEGFVVWDVLYGARYRIGPIGGAHYTRIETRITGVQAVGHEIVYRAIAPENDLFSPFFGGHIELDPVELFTVYADVRVVNWAWEAIGLRDQRTFLSRMGLSLSLFDGLVGVATDFRFLSTYLDTGNSRTARNRAEYQLDGVGIGIEISAKY